jgi:hypothetical protein
MRVFVLFILMWTPSGGVCTTDSRLLQECAARGRTPYNYLHFSRFIQTKTRSIHMPHGRADLAGYVAGHTVLRIDSTYRISMPHHWLPRGHGNSTQIPWHTRGLIFFFATGCIVSQKYPAATERPKQGIPSIIPVSGHERNTSMSW